MNYISQLNGFRRWRGQHALSPFAQLLWYSLTVEQNHRLWPERFAISSNDLRQIIGGVGPNTLRHARNELVEAGLVEATVARRGGEVTTYRMTQLYEEIPAADPSADPSAEPSAEASECAETPPNQSAAALLKPQNLKTEKQECKPGRCKQDGGTIERGLASPARQTSATGNAGAGSSRSRTRWRTEPLYGL